MDKRQLQRQLSQRASRMVKRMGILGPIGLVGPSRAADHGSKYLQSGAVVRKQLGHGQSRFE